EFIKRSSLPSRCADASGRRDWVSAVLLCVFPSFRAKPQEGHCFLIKAGAFVPIPEGFAQDAPDNPWPKVIRVVEPVDGCHHVRAAQFRVRDVWNLVAAAVS